MVVITVTVSRLANMPCQSANWRFVAAARPTFELFEVTL